MNAVPAVLPEVQNRPRAHGLYPGNDCNGVLCVQVSVVGEIDVAIRKTTELLGSRRKSVGSGGWPYIMYPCWNVSVAGDVFSAGHATERVDGRRIGNSYFKFK